MRRRQPAQADQHIDRADELLFREHRLGYPRDALLQPLTCHRRPKPNPRGFFRETLPTSRPLRASRPCHDRRDVMTITDLGGRTSGTETAELFPKSSVARAFSQRRAETLWLWTGNQEDVLPSPTPADDDSAGANVETQTSFVPIRVGTPAPSGRSILVECYYTAC